MRNFSLTRFPPTKSRIVVMTTPSTLHLLSPTSNRFTFDTNTLVFRWFRRHMLISVLWGGCYNYIICLMKMIVYSTFFTKYQNLLCFAIWCDIIINIIILDWDRIYVIFFVDYVMFQAMCLVPNHIEYNYFTQWLIWRGKISVRLKT